MFFVLRLNLLLGAVAGLLGFIADKPDSVLFGGFMAVISLLCMIEDHLENLRDAFECDADTKGADRG